MTNRPTHVSVKTRPYNFYCIKERLKATKEEASKFISKLYQAATISLIFDRDNFFVLGATKFVFCGSNKCVSMPVPVSACVCVYMCVCV